MSVRLSDAQKQVLVSSVQNRGKIGGGRYGFSLNILRALEKRGLCKMVSRSTWDSCWETTEDGARVAAEVNNEGEAWGTLEH